MVIHDLEFFFGQTADDYLCYDVENYPNVFTMYVISDKTEREWVFEISERKNDCAQLCAFIDVARSLGSSKVGFNNNHYDYPVIHYIYNHRGDNNGQGPRNIDIFKVGQAIIDANSRFDSVREYDRVIRQIDLRKMWHYDNKSRIVSLKQLEFVMRMDNLADLPYPPGSIIPVEEIPNLIAYNRNDVIATLNKLRLSRDHIELREAMSAKYGGKDFINFSDSKIGSEIIIDEIEKAKPGTCFVMEGKSKKMRQTRRESINLGELIFPFIQFNDPEFNRVLNFMKSQTITETKGVFKNVVANVGGIGFKFGLGGIHASVSKESFVENNEFEIEDIDVDGFYPRIGYAWQLYPEHLSTTWCDTLVKIRDERAVHKKVNKGGVWDRGLKIAGNGSYGNTNSEYSSFYDPAYTMRITLNGQFMLCMLAEQLLKCPDLRIIQANTDGLTIYRRREYAQYVEQVKEWWSSLTRMVLDTAYYKAMYVRDVNNYLAIDRDGKAKQKGAYDCKPEYHKNHSQMVVRKAVLEHVTKGRCYKDYIYKCADIFDFMIFLKVPKASDIVAEDGRVMGKAMRYIVSKQGVSMFKNSPPKGPEGAYVRKSGKYKVSDEFYYSVLAEVGGEWDERIHTKNKSRYGTVTEAIKKGYKLIECNKLDESKKEFLFDLIDYDYYVDQAEKLIKFSVTDEEDKEDNE